MGITLTLPGVLASAPALQVLGPNHMGRLNFLRASPAWSVDASGSGFSVGADIPRFPEPAQRLLIEEARVNMIRNPRALGSIAGTPGTLPTHWNHTPPSGMTSAVVGSGTEQGLPYIDLRFTAPAGLSGVYSLYFDAANAVPTPGSQVWAFSLHARLLEGSTAGVGSIGLDIVTRDEQAVSLGNVNGPAINPGAAQLAAGRIVQIVTAPPSAAFMSPRLRIAFNSGSRSELTLRLAAPQMERGAVATSPILPDGTGIGAAGRAADMAAWHPPGGFGGSGSVVLRAALPAPAPFGTIQGLLQIDDGTDANRLTIRNTSAGAGIFGVAESAGATLAALPGGNMTPGLPFRAAIAWAPGDFAFCLNGGAVQSAAATLPAGLARMLVGHAAGALNRAANGEVGPVEFRPTRLPDAMLQALTGAA